MDMEPRHKQKLMIYTSYSEIKQDNNSESIQTYIRITSEITYPQTIFIRGKPASSPVPMV